jgi:hypothetical protein
MLRIDWIACLAIKVELIKQLKRYLSIINNYKMNREEKPYKIKIFHIKISNRNNRIK